MCLCVCIHIHSNSHRLRHMHLRVRTYSHTAHPYHGPSHFHMCMLSVCVYARVCVRVCARACVYTLINLKFYPQKSVSSCTP